jgi:hypothetical protein
MQDIKQKIADQQQQLKKLATSIPGFGGYLQKDDRREADKLLRLALARQLEQERKHLKDAAVQLAGAGNLKAVGDVDRANTKLRTLIDKIKTATYGHAGFFDALRVEEAQLDALYAYDNSMVQGVPMLAAAVTALGAAVTAKDSLDAGVAGVLAAIDQLATAWNQRQEVILQA